MRAIREKSGNQIRSRAMLARRWRRGRSTITDLLNGKLVSERLRTKIEELSGIPRERMPWGKNRPGDGGNGN